VSSHPIWIIVRPASFNLVVSKEEDSKLAVGELAGLREQEVQ
jgi:hypothetical protein